MNELLSLKPMQMDALREVANIGAGHAATALSQMTNQRIMISVPQISVTPLEEVSVHIGDRTGRTLLVFPRNTAMRVAEMMLRKPEGSVTELGKLEQSAIMEAGNILSGAHMNALSDFMGIMLLPSPPSLVIDMSRAVLTTAYLQFGDDPNYVFCVETEFFIMDQGKRVRGFFLLLPDAPSLKAILRAVRLA